MRSIKKTVSFISTSQGGRDVEMKRLIDSIRKFSDCEFVFVDQNLNKNSFVERWIEGSLINFVHIKIDKAISLSSARNLAIERSTGDLIVFCDDDAVYENDFLEKVNSLYSEDNFKDVYIYKVLEIESGKPYGNRNYPEKIEKLKIDDLMKLGLSLSLILHREFAKEVGGFDERLGVGTGLGCGEESDFLLRCLSLGANVRYTPNISVFHPAFDKNDVNNYEKVKKYSKGYAYVCMKQYGSMKLNISLKWHLINIVIRTLGGILISKNRVLYANRFFGLCSGILFCIKK